MDIKFRTAAMLNRSGYSCLWNAERKRCRAILLTSMFPADDGVLHDDIKLLAVGQGISGSPQQGISFGECQLQSDGESLNRPLATILYRGCFARHRSRRGMASSSGVEKTARREWAETE